MTKQNTYDSTEELSRIYFEFMGEYYGTRTVLMPLPEEVKAAYEVIGRAAPEKVPTPFDFTILKLHPMRLKLDVGASTYYSEIAAISTLENLLRQGAINTVQFLERIPEDYVPKKFELIEEIRAEIEEQKRMQMLAQGIMPPDAAGTAPTPTPQAPIFPEETPSIPQGGGYSALQRKINETGSTEGLI